MLFIRGINFDKEPWWVNGCLDKGCLWANYFYFYLVAVRISDVWKQKLPWLSNLYYYLLFCELGVKVWAIILWFEDVKWLFYWPDYDSKKEEVLIWPIFVTIFEFDWDSVFANVTLASITFVDDQGFDFTVEAKPAHRRSVSCQDHFVSICINNRRELVKEIVLCTKIYFGRQPRLKKWQVV